MKFYIAADHGGYQLKEKIKQHFSFEWVDLGTHSDSSVDYPDFAHALADKLKQDPDAKGILICGSGIGMSIAANRYPHIRAALCTTAKMAKLSREHNDANVLVLGERIIDIDTALECVTAFLESKFEGGRHERRVGKINKKCE